MWVSGNDQGARLLARMRAATAAERRVSVKFQSPLRQGVRMKHPLAGLLFVAATAPGFAQDPAETDSDKYKVLLDNACVRVLEYRDQPGEKTQQHRHPAFLLYAIEPFERVIHLPDGGNINRRFEAGEVIWSPAQTHIGENSGGTPTHALIVESKPSGLKLPECEG